MSKKKPSATGNRPASAKAAKAAPPARKKSIVEKWSFASSADGLLKKVFWGIAAAGLIIMLFVAPHVGINGDDEFQVDYSEKLVAYYSTFGKDTAALYIEKGNMHYYGGFFDLVTGFINKAIGYTPADVAYHQVRHLFNAFMGFLAMLFIGLLARHIAGWRAGILAFLFAFFTPGFFGHSMLNPKDIPFAAGFAIALYYMALLLHNLPKVRWQEALGLTIGIAVAFATRAGGVLLIAYLGLFLGLDFLNKYGWKGLTKESNIVGRYALVGVGIAAAAYFLAVLTWPAALAAPLSHPFKALSEFTNLGIKIRVLFQGENLMSDKTAWYYPIVWITKTIPLAVLVGFWGGVALFAWLIRRLPAIPVGLAVFAAIFPVAYIIYKDSILHDGWRHIMFVYPGIVVTASVFWIAMERFAGKWPFGKYIVWGLVALGTFDAAAFIVRNPTLSYVYFNPIGGGLKGAFGYYETDYCGVGVKQALNWMEKEGIIGADMKDTVTIGTSFFYSTLFLTSDPKYNGKIKVVYTRFNQRYSEAWDYGIYPSRYIRGPHLRAGTWPNSKTAHTVKANGVPIIAVEKDLNRFAYKGEQATKVQDWAAAKDAFEEETRLHADNELAWQGLANAHLNLSQFAETIRAADESLKIAPDNEQSLFYKGLAYANTNDGSNAIATLERLVKINDEYFYAHYYLGVLYQGSGDPDRALKSAIRSIELNPRFKQGYELAASLYEQQGDARTAAAYREAAAKVQ
jgi:hypothetical protein